MIIYKIYGKIYKTYKYKGVLAMEETIRRVRKFRKDREWDQFHSPSNLAKAISIEAAELLEEFLWDNENYNKKITLKLLSEHFHISADYISHEFRKIYGISPLEFREKYKK